MRKSLIMLALAALAVSCAQTEESKELQVEKKQIFHATIEGAETKVFVGPDMHILWNQNDTISIFAQSTRNKPWRFTGSDGASGGDFEELTTGTFGTGSAIYCNYAIYPYRASNACATNGVLSATFPGKQTYREGSFGRGANLMVAKSSNEDLSFKNASSYLCLQLYGSGKAVRSIVLRGNNGEYLAGPVNITIGSNGIPSVAFDTGKADELRTQITLNAADDPVALGAEPVTFWIAVPPVTLSNGFTVTVIDADGNLHRKRTKAETVFERRTQTLMAAFEIGDVEPVALSLGIKDLASDIWTYDKTTDQLNIYEAEDKVWARFLRIPTLTMYEIGPIPSSATVGTRFLATIQVSTEGNVTSTQRQYFTVQTVSGGLMRLVSDEGQQWTIRF